MTETHPIRKHYIDIDNELDALNVTPEMLANWRELPASKALILHMQTQILDTYILLGETNQKDDVNRGAIAVLEEYIEWGKPDEEGEDDATT